MARIIKGQQSPLRDYSRDHGHNEVTQSGHGVIIYISLGLYSLSRRASYRKILRSLEATRFGFRLTIVLQFDKHLRNSAADMYVKFHYNTQSHGFETSWAVAVRRLTA